MTRNEVDAAALFIKQCIQEVAPYDTGNLANNALRFERKSDREVVVYINTEGDHKQGALDGIAPYQRYLNELPKSVHYKWWEDAVNAAIHKLADKLGGDVVNEIFEEASDDQ